jgi:hypothetical protein
MATMYFVNILHRILIYFKNTLSVTIISRPFMLITIFEYTCNIVIHIHLKYTFVNLNLPNYMP